MDVLVFPDIHIILGVLPVRCRLRCRYDLHIFLVFMQRDLDAGSDRPLYSDNVRNHGQHKAYNKAVQQLAVLAARHQVGRLIEAASLTTAPTRRARPSTHHAACLVTPSSPSNARRRRLAAGDCISSQVERAPAVAKRSKVLAAFSGSRIACGLTTYRLFRAPR